MNQIKLKKKFILMRKILLPQETFMQGDVVYVEDIFWEKPYFGIAIHYTNKSKGIGEALFSNQSKTLKIKTKQKLREYAGSIIAPYLGDNVEHTIYLNDNIIEKPKLN